MSLPLFDDTRPAPEPFDPSPTFLHRTPKASHPRLSQQCLDILALLKQGPATNRDICGIAMRYSARIAECRQAGFNIVCVSEDKKTGLAVYELQEQR